MPITQKKSFITMSLLLPHNGCLRKTLSLVGLQKTRDFFFYVLLPIGQVLSKIDKLVALFDSK
jgi:hypothetical protein